MLTYGVMMYDIPLTQRSLYNKLRKKIRHYGVPLTQSCLLIPWAARGEIQAILDCINNEKPGVISSCIIKFDDSEEKKLAQAAQDGLSLMLKNAKALMMKRLEKAEENQKSIMAQISLNEPNLEPGLADQARAEVKNQYLFDHKKAVKHAETALEGARRLALIFNLSDQLEFGFAAMEELVKLKWALIGVKDAPVEEKEEVEA